MNFLIILFYLIIILLLIDFIKKNIKKNLNDPPGPISLPIIGNLHQLTFLPHKGLTNLSDKYDGIYKIYFGDIYTVVVTDPYIIRQIWVENFKKYANRFQLKSLKTFSNNYNSLGLSNYDVWSKINNIILVSLTKTKIIQKSSTTINKLTKDIINYLNSKCAKNNYYIMGKDDNTIKTFSLKVLLEILFSKKLKDENEEINQFVKAVIKVFDYLGKGNLSDFISIFRPFYYFQDKDYQLQLKYLMGLIDEIYNEHLLNLDYENPKDLIDQLIIETNGNDKEFVKTVAIDLILAGNDTKYCAIEYFILFMINNPEIQEKLFNEINETFNKNNNQFINYNDTIKLPFFNACLKETLRLKPPAPLGLFRYSSEDGYVGENNQYFIPKNTMIFQNIYGLNNSKQFIENHEIFDPSRWLIGDSDDQLQQQNIFCKKNKYYNKLDKISNIFSLGLRKCPGEQIAKVELNTFLVNLLLNFKLESIDNNKIDENELFFVTIRPKSFNIKFIKRK